MTAAASATGPTFHPPAFEPVAAIRDALRVVLEIDTAHLQVTTALADLGADSLVLVSVADVVEQAAAQAGVPFRYDDAELAAAHTLGDLAALAP